MQKLALATMAALSFAAAATADAKPLLGNALAAAAAGAAAAAAAAGAASAGGGCQDADCPRNGPQLTGIALSDVKARRPIIKVVTLPSGDRVDLR